MFQFLIVKFDQTPDRTVLANGHPVGVTNHMLPRLAARLWQLHIILHPRKLQRSPRSLVITRMSDNIFN